MKRIIAVFLTLLLLSSCGKTTVPNHEQSSVKQDEVAVTSEIEKKEVTSSVMSEDIPVVNNGEYYEAEIIDNPASGEPQSYDELVLFLESYENLTFISYEIISVYDAQTAYAITSLDSVLRVSTLYKVHVYYDHINNCSVDYYLDLVHAGNAATQYEGFPIYMVGQRFMSAVFGDEETWKVPVGELEFLLINQSGIEYAYHLGDTPMIPAVADDQNLSIALTDSEAQMVTSTINNPMVFSQKSAADSLSEFIRTDWANRNIAR